MARCRRNVDNFLEACRKIGVDEVRNILLISFKEVCASLSLRVYYTCMRHAVIISVQHHVDTVDTSIPNKLIRCVSNFSLTNGDVARES